MMPVLSFFAYGHPNISCRHDKTIEFTTDKDIGKVADCIVGIRSDFDIRKMDFLKDNVKVKVTMTANGKEESLMGYGHPDLHIKGCIFRRSNVINDKTALIRCNKTARQLDRNFVKELQSANTKIEIVLEVIDTYTTDGIL
jgi:hypothetical protein